MATSIRSAHTRLSCLALAALLFTVGTATSAALGSLYTLSASGTIVSNSSGDPTVPVGTPWTFELTYDTGAPDRDFEVTSSPDPSFGRFTNGGVPPALTAFHYKAGTYEVTIGDPTEFAAGSEILVTFTAVHALDVNLFAPAKFPSLAGVPVSFHADFNAFSQAPIFTGDGLPTNTALGAGSFDQSTVSLLPLSHGEVAGSVTSLTLTPVPEPGPGVSLLTIGGLAGAVRRSRRKAATGGRSIAATLSRATS